MQLTPQESLLTEQELFFQWLLSGRVNFNELSEAYVAYLEKKREEQKKVVLCASHALVLHATKFFNFKKNKNFRDAKTAYAILQCNRVGGEFKKQCEETVERLGYSEDENGFPVWREK